MINNFINLIFVPNTKIFNISHLHINVKQNIILHYLFVIWITILKRKQLQNLSIKKIIASHRQFNIATYR